MSDIEDVLALSPLQTGLFSLARLAGDDDLYAMQFVIDIAGALDVGRLRRCADELLVRHAYLRAAFWDHDLPQPVAIVPTAAGVPWEEVACEPSEFDGLVAAEQHRPFDLAHGPVLRMLLVWVGDTCRLVLTAHHILMDGWSVGVFFRELFARYAGADLPPARPYREYIGWLSARDDAGALQAWTDYLAGLPGPVVVGSTDAVNTVAPQVHKHTLSVAQTARLTDWARTHGLTLNTVTQYVWAQVLGRLTGRDDVVFGTTITGRPDDLPGVEGMIGLFINTVPVRIRLADSDIGATCQELQRESARMRDAGYLSLATIQRAAGHGALFDTLFVFENAPVADVLRPITIDGVTFAPISSDSLTHYPLAVVAYVLDGALTVVVEALPELAAHRVGARMVQALSHLASGGAPEVLLPDELPQADVRPGPELTVPELFSRQAHATPDALALTTDAEQLTYRELHDAVARLAGALAAHGVGPEDVVALAMPRSAAAFVAILAVLGAGAAYVPIDIGLPQDRIDAILAQASPKLTLTSVELDGTAPGFDGSAPVRAPRPHNAAYLIFTSGSTGEPKGVVGSHAALTSYFTDHRDRVYRPATARLGRPLVIAHAWSLSFDASWQPLVGLLDGHTIALFDETDMRDAQRLVDGMVRRGVDMIDTTPSMFCQLAAAGLLARHRLAVLALGGEAIGTTLWRSLSELDGVAVHNCYGPTETTVEAVVARVTGTVPNIGTPVDGMTGYVLDARLRPVPHGVPGELYLSGHQVARGYASRPALTAQRFVADPSRPGAVLYRTGDVVRRLASGELAFLGRADDQVKIRGYRIELGDIEAALLRARGVQAAAVVVARARAGTSLVAFVVGETDGLRAELARTLPSYMVPARIVATADLPMNRNGKLDVPALTARAHRELATHTARAPRTDTEATLCRVFAEVTGATADPEAELVALGLDSIVAIGFVNALRRNGVAVNPRMVLAAGTIADLAAAVDSGARTESPDATEEFGPVAPVPVLSWMLEHASGPRSYRNFTLDMMVRLPAGISQAQLEAVLQALLDSHEMLRAVLVDEQIVTRPPGVVRAAELFTPTGIDPAAGHLVRASRVGTDRLLLRIHHIAVDPVSWHIILGDLAHAWQQVQAGDEPKPAVEFTSYRQWARLLNERDPGTQRDYWRRQVEGPEPALGTRLPDPATDTLGSCRVQVVTMPAAFVDRLTPGVGVREILLAALSFTVAEWRRERGQNATAGTTVLLEAHGRADAQAGTPGDGLDTAQTVGWFTSLFPARLGAGAGSARAHLDAVCAHLAAVPNQGADYGVLRYLRGDAALAAAPEPQVLFSYLGRLDLAGGTDGAWAPVTELGLLDQLPAAPEPNFPMRQALDVIAGVQAAETAGGTPQLVTLLRYGRDLFSKPDIEHLAARWRRAVDAVVRELP